MFKFFSVCFFLCLSACTVSQREAPQFEPVSPETRSSLKQQLMAGYALGPDEQIDERLNVVETICKNFRQSLPKDWFQDFIVVPENPNEPYGRQTKIFYYGRLPSETDENPAAKIPVVFFNGGPGGSSHSSYRRLTETQNKLLEWKSLPFIFIDQRGNGCSDPYPKGSDLETISRLAHYGTREIVADAEAIRKKVFGQKAWKVFGQSYGAFIAHRYLVDAPQGIHSIHAHGNALNTDPVLRFTERIASQHRILERYFQQYPDDRLILENLRSALPADKCYEDSSPKDKYCGVGLLAPLVYFLGFQNNWERLHLWLNVMWDSEGFNEIYVKRFAELYSFSDDDSLNVMQYVLARVDRNVEATCDQVFEKLENSGLSVSEILIHECLSATQFPEQTLTPEVQKMINDLPLNHLTIDRFKTALVGNPQIPFYLYSGDLDAFVPQANFEEQVQAVGEFIRYTAFRGTGHDGFFSEPLVWRNLLK